MYEKCELCIRGLKGLTILRGHILKLLLIVLFSFPFGRPPRFIIILSPLWLSAFLLLGSNDSFFSVIILRTTSRGLVFRWPLWGRTYLLMTCRTLVRASGGCCKYLSPSSSDESSESEPPKMSLSSSAYRYVIFNDYLICMCEQRSTLSVMFWRVDRDMMSIIGERKYLLFGSDLSSIRIFCFFKKSYVGPVNMRLVN